MNSYFNISNILEPNIGFMEVFENITLPKHVKNTNDRIMK